MTPLFRAAVRLDDTARDEEVQGYGLADARVTDQLRNPGIGKSMSLNFLVKDIAIVVVSQRRVNVFAGGHGQFISTRTLLFPRTRTDIDFLMSPGGIKLPVLLLRDGKSSQNFMVASLE